jgi:hypothetical protein
VNKDTGKKPASAVQAEPANIEEAIRRRAYELYEERGRDRVEGRTSLHLCGKPAGRCGGAGKHALSQLQKDLDSSLWVSHHRLPDHRSRLLPIMRHRIPGQWDRTFQGQITSHPYVPAFRVRSQVVSLS